MKAVSVYSMYLPISLYKSLFTYTEPLQDGNNAVAIRRVGTKKIS